MVVVVVERVSVSECRTPYPPTFYMLDMHNRLDERAGVTAVVVAQHATGWPRHMSWARTHNEREVELRVIQTTQHKRSTPVTQRIQSQHIHSSSVCDDAIT